MSMRHTQTHVWNHDPATSKYLLCQPTNGQASSLPSRNDFRKFGVYKLGRLLGAVCYLFISISIVMEAAGKSTIDKCHTIYRQRNAIKLTFKWLTLNGCEIDISKVWILLRHCIPHGAYMLLKETCSTSPIGVFVYSFIYFYQQKHHWKLRNSTKISHKLCLKLIKKHMKMNAYLVAKC